MKTLDDPTLTFDQSEDALEQAGVARRGVWSYVRTEDVGQFRNVHVFRGIRAANFRQALLLVPRKGNRSRGVYHNGYKVLVTAAADERNDWLLRN